MGFESPAGLWPGSSSKHVGLEESQSEVNGFTIHVLSGYFQVLTVAKENAICFPAVRVAYRVQIDLKLLQKTTLPIYTPSNSVKSFHCH